MKATFLLHALPAVLQFEGGYTDNPNDSGGPTNYGITQAEYDLHREACGEATQSVLYITQPEVDHIYLNSYWMPCQCDDLPYPLDWLTFDAAVNMGCSVAADLLEQALGDNENGIVSQALVSQINTHCATLAGTHVLKVNELADRVKWYQAIVNDHPQDQEFYQGWINRVNELAAES